MKTCFSLLIIVIFPVALLAQANISLSVQPEGEVIRAVGKHSPGTRLTLEGFTSLQEGGPHAIISHTDGSENISLNRLDRIHFEPRNLAEFWTIKAIEYKVYSNILRHGYQNSMRSRMESEFNDYLAYLENNDLFLLDSYLENYIQTLALRIFPGSLSDGRRGSFSVKIVKDTNPNASIYTNGTMLISSGMLSLLESEEELIAVLAQELAHFVLDHSVININTANRRQQRAEFWAALATGVAAVADIHHATKNPYHIPGELTFATAVLSFAVASSVTDHMGLEFSSTQKIEAGKVAHQLFSFMGKNPDALSSVLLKLRGNQGRIHPLNETAGVGNYGTFGSTLYDARISFVNTFNAKQYLFTKDYHTAGMLARRNIDAGVAVEDDYLVLAAINMAMFDDEQSNREVMQFIQTAKTLNISPSLGLYKQESLALLRLGLNADAEESLKKYHHGLIEQEMMMGYNQYLSREIEWAAKMIARVRFL